MSDEGEDKAHQPYVYFKYLIYLFFNAIVIVILILKK